METSVPQPRKVGALLVVFGVGIALGVLGGHRYAEQRIGRDLLTLEHADSVTTLKSYERIRELLRTGHEEGLSEYLDAMIELHETTLRATELSLQGVASR